MADQFWYFPTFRITQPHDIKRGFLYGSVMRVRPLREWPHSTVVVGLEVRAGSKSVARGSVAIVSYGAETAALQASYKTFRFESFEGRILKGTIHLEEGKEVNQKLPDPQPAQPGELDIYLEFQSEEAWPDAGSFLESLTYTVILKLAEAFWERFEPVGPISFITPEHRFDASVTVPMSTGVEQEISEKNIEVALQELLKERLVRKARYEEFSAAARRYLQAQSKPWDFVNTFIDYWLICVLLTRHIRHKDEARRIARVLSPFLPAVTENQIFDRLTKPLDRVRNRIFHSDGHMGLDSPEDASVAHQLALALLRIEVGVSFTINDILMNRLLKEDARTPKPRHH